MTALTELVSIVSIAGALLAGAILIAFLLAVWMNGGWGGKQLAPSPSRNGRPD